LLIKNIPTTTAHRRLGFHTRVLHVDAGIDGHPAVKAISPQAARV